MKNITSMHRIIKKAVTFIKNAFNQLMYYTTNSYRIIQKLLKTVCQVAQPQILFLIYLLVNVIPDYTSSIT